MFEKHVSHQLLNGEWRSHQPRFLCLAGELVERVEHLSITSLLVFEHVAEDKSMMSPNLGERNLSLAQQLHQEGA